MANPTMSLISSYTVGSGGAGTVVFSSLPSTYTDLAIKVSAANSAMYLKFNTDTNTGNYSAKILRSDYAVGVSSITNAVFGYYIFCGYSGATSVFSSFDIYIPKYALSDIKTVSIDSFAEGNSTDEWSTLIAGAWNQTSAINQITFDGGGGTFAQYSTFYLYGIKNS